MATTIAQAVSAICLRAGLTADQFDVTALESITQPLRAMAISQVTSARQVLDMLASAYFFEAVASDKIYFRPRGGAPVKTLSYQDLGMYNAGQDMPGPLVLTDGNELELPAQIALTYHNIDGDYQTDTQYSDRLLSSMQSTSTLSLPLGLTASEAKAMADAMLIDSVVSLLTTTLHLGLAHSELEPTDVVIATGDDGSTYRPASARSRPCSTMPRCSPRPASPTGPRHHSPSCCRWRTLSGCCSTSAPCAMTTTRQATTRPSAAVAAAPGAPQACTTAPTTPPTTCD